MSPIPSHQLSPRNISSDERYTIVFTVLGSVILICSVLWGYVIPKWKKKREKAVQTRYNCTAKGENQNISQKDELQHQFELPVIFPPHPAVVVPLNKKIQSSGHHYVYNQTSILVYDPRVQSPFPNRPRPAVCRPLPSDVFNKPVPASQPKSLHAARLRQSQPQIPTKSIHRFPLPTTPNPLQRQRNGNLGQHRNTKGDKSSLLVPRPAGAPPPKSPAAQIKSTKSKHEFATWEDATKLSSSTATAISTRDFKSLRRQDQTRPIDSDSSADHNKTPDEHSNNMDQSAGTPAQAGSGIRNIFETPSSLETSSTSRFDSLAKHTHDNSTPPTAPNSSVLQREETSLYPGITNLVPSRRFKGYMSASRTKPPTDAIAEADPTLSSEEINDSHHVLRGGVRPISAPPSSSKQPRMTNRDLPEHPSLPGLDSMTDIQLHRNRSPRSSRSSSDSSDLLPRPLSLRRTITSKSPLVSPTPAGRKMKNKEAHGDSLRRKLAHLRSAIHDKSPQAKRRIHTLRSRRHSGNQRASPEPSTYVAYQNLEDNPFMDRVGLAGLGGDRKRSSLASLSTLKIPKSFRSRISRGGSSTYSRDTKGVSVLPSPALASKLSSPVQSLPELNTKRANSFDETIFQDLDWTPLFDDNSGNDVSLASEADKENCAPAQSIPRTPTFPRNEQSTPQTPINGTASSNIFGSKMPIPKISIARSSDDVFRRSSPASSPATRRNRDENEKDAVVFENGRVFKRIRAMESKLSHEDLIKYGKRTAPGGVEWF